MYRLLRNMLFFTCYKKQLPFNSQWVTAKRIYFQNPITAIFARREIVSLFHLPRTFCADAYWRRWKTANPLCDGFLQSCFEQLNITSKKHCFLRFFHKNRISVFFFQFQQPFTTIRRSRTIHTILEVTSRSRNTLSTTSTITRCILTTYFYFHI